MLETERLALRNWQESDAERLFQLASDPLVGPECGWTPHCSVEESRALIVNGPLGKPESYSIHLRDTDEIIGSISLKDAAENFDIANEDDLEVGYWLGSSYWGHGYASEALDAMVRRAFDDLGRDVLWCGFFEGNERSKHCMEKRGFKFIKTTPAFERPLLGDTATAYLYRLEAKKA